MKDNKNKEVLEALFVIQRKLHSVENEVNDIKIALHNMIWDLWKTEELVILENGSLELKKQK